MKNKKQKELLSKLITKFEEKTGDKIITISVHFKKMGRM
jgi:hypothetical protein